MTMRYIRQICVPGVGAAGQKRLEDASVLVVGAGGLGCPVLAYLAGAGVGTIRIVDPDRVEESNLHRQTLYSEGDVGRPKAMAAEAALRRRNATIRIDAVAASLTPDNAATLAAGMDVVVDAADSFAVTYILSDLCHARAIPLVSGAVAGPSGYAGVFCGGGPSYRAVFPELPGLDGGCDADGILGPVVGILGSILAHDVLQLLLGSAPSPLGRVTRFEASRMSFGGFSFLGAPEPDFRPAFIAASSVTSSDIVFDLRDAGRAVEDPLPNARWLDSAHLDGAIGALPPGSRVVLCCESGARAMAAAHAMHGQGVADISLLSLR